MHASSCASRPQPKTTNETRHQNPSSKPVIKIPLKPTCTLGRAAASACSVMRALRQCMFISRSKMLQYELGATNKILLTHRDKNPVSWKVLGYARKGLVHRRANRCFKHSKQRALLTPRSLLKPGAAARQTSRRHRSSSVHQPRAQPRRVDCAAAARPIRYCRTASC